MVLILLQVLLASLRVLGFAPFTAHLADKVKESREILMLFLSLTFISHAQTQCHIRHCSVLMCKQASQSQGFIPKNFAHICQSPWSSSRHWCWPWEGYLLLSGTPKALVGQWHQAGVWLGQSLRMGGHQHTLKVSSFQENWQCILYPRLFSSAVWYFLGNFSTKIVVAVTKMHQKLFRACSIQIPSACGLSWIWLLQLMPCKNWLLCDCCQIPLQPSQTMLSHTKCSKAQSKQKL